MRIALVTVQSHRTCTLKDVAGGFGTTFEIGRSLPARLLQNAKGRLISLPPLTLGYLAAQLEAAGHTIEIHAMRRFAPYADPIPNAELVVLWTSIVDHQAERTVMHELREAGIRCIAIGAYASAKPMEFIDIADAVVVGESEALGPQLANRSLEGLVEAGTISNLDTLPYPAWHHFPHETYRYAMLSHRGPTLPVATARGCAYGCGYCPWRVTSTYRERDPARVVEELQFMKERYRTRAFAFRDPLFNLDIERTKELAERFEPLNIRFSAEMRADRLDETLLIKLWRAGLRSLEIGVESVDRKMLAQYRRKPPQHAHIRRVVSRAQKLGIRVICNYMIGLPEDDEARIRDTVHWAKELDSFAVQFTVATPYPGTSLDHDTRGLRLPSKPTMTGFQPTFRHPTLTTEKIESLREWAYVSYHFRPKYFRRFAHHALATLWD